MTNIVREITRVPLISTDERKGIIGGSQIGAICNLENSYSSEYEVYKAYKGLPIELSDTTKETFAAGHILEEPIAQFFTYKTNQPVKELDFMYADPDNPALILHPDREFTNLVDGKRYALECKTASVNAVNSKKWPEPVLLEKDKRPSWFPENVELYDGKTVNPGYYAQCMWYYALAGYDGVFLTRLTDNKFIIYYVEPNLADEKFFYENALAWKKAVDNGYVPDAKNFEETKEKYPSAALGSTMEADEDLMTVIKSFSMLKEQEKEIKQNIDDLQTIIVEKMQDKEVILYQDKKILSYKNSVKGGFDAKALKDDNPELYKKYFDPEYTKYRTMRVYIEKDEENRKSA